MDCHVLAIGDVMGEPGLRHLEDRLRALQKWKNITFTVVNGENAAGVGLTEAQAWRIYDAGADVVTLGNHAFGRREICGVLNSLPWLLRPANLGERAPGRGWGIYHKREFCFRVVNLIGRCSLCWNADNPFFTAEKILTPDRNGDSNRKQDKNENRQSVSEIHTPSRDTCGSGGKSPEKPFPLNNSPRDIDFTLVDFHAEATSEKIALGYYLDGRVSALWGTHTHVPTADERINPRGSGYITDVGMTGLRESVLGVPVGQSLEQFLGGVPEGFRFPAGNCKMQGAIFTLDSDTGLCKHVERVEIL